MRKVDVNCKTAKTVFLISSVVFVVMALVVFGMRKGGFDYNIYNYFSSHFYDHSNPYKAPATPINYIYESYRDPAILDYTGLQQLIYNGCYFLSHFVWWRLDGYILYSLLLMGMVLLLVYWGYTRGDIRFDEYCCFLSLFLSPYLWFSFFLNSYEDKIGFILIPVAVLLAHRQTPVFQAILLGFFTGWVGVPAAVLPLLLLDHAIKPKILLRARAGRSVEVVLPFLLGLAVALVPYFPDALAGWVRRSSLEQLSPQWYSLWLLLGPAYHPGLNKVAIVLASAWVYVRYFSGKTSRRAAVILLFSLPFVLSVIMPAHRILPAVVLMSLVFQRKATCVSYTVLAHICTLGLMFADLKWKVLHQWPSPHQELLAVVVATPVLIAGALLLVEARSSKSRESVA